MIIGSLCIASHQCSPAICAVSFSGAFCNKGTSAEVSRSSVSSEIAALRSVLSRSNVVAYGLIEPMHSFLCYLYG